RRTVERTVEVVGTLKGWEDVTVGSKRPGRVAKVLHDMGDRVKPREPLVELETVDAELAVLEAEKRLAAELARIGLTELPATKETRGEARQAQIDMVLRAPFPTQPPGRTSESVTYAVTKRSVAEGQMVREGDPVAELVIENPLRLWTNVPERFAAEVELGQPA